MKAEWIEIIVGAYGPDMKVMKLARRITMEEFLRNTSIMPSIVETMATDFEEMTGSKSEKKAILG